MRVVEQAAAAAAARTIRRLAAALRDVPGVQTEERADGIVVTGHNIGDEPALRWPAGLIR